MGISPRFFVLLIDKPFCLILSKQKGLLLLAEKFCINSITLS
jgi:hypothetical protein